MRCSEHCAPISRTCDSCPSFTHTLADGVSFSDNPNCDAREGAVLPFKTGTVTVMPRINFANAVSPRFVPVASRQ